MHMGTNVDLRPAIPAECLSVNGLLAVWPSLGLYGRAVCKHIKQDSARIRACNRTLGVATLRYGGMPPSETQWPQRWLGNYAESIVTMGLDF
jgi:hypothetical protein